MPVKEGARVDHLGNVIADPNDGGVGQGSAAAQAAHFKQADRQDVQAVKTHVKSGYSGHVPGARNEVGGSYNGIDGTYGGAHLTRTNLERADWAAKARAMLPELAKKQAADPLNSPAKDISVEAQALANSMTPAPARVDFVLEGGDVSNASPKQVASGYTGHVPRSAMVCPPVRAGDAHLDLPMHLSTH